MKKFILIFCVSLFINRVSCMNVPYEESDQQLVYEEIFKSSRIPTTPEMAPAKTLREVFANRGVVIDEIRFVDAGSLISGMNLSNDRKNYYCSFLGGSADFSNLLSEFAEKRCTFSNKDIKTKVLNDIKEGSQNSTIYRDLMVAFIARTEANPSFSDRLIYSDEVLASSASFTCGKCGSCYKAIAMDYGSEVHNIGSLFRHPDSELGENLYIYPISWQNILFHECGHVIELFPNNNDILKLSETTWDMAAQFIEAKIDDKNLDIYCQLLKEDKAQHERFFNLYQYISGKTTDDIVQVINTMKALSQSRDGVAKILLNNLLEIWQILGVMLLKHENKTTLYINTLSDFFLNAQLGLPLRYDHMDYKKNEEFNYPTFVKYEMPTEIYEALLAVHGISMQSYIQKQKLTYKN